MNHRKHSLASVEDLYSLLNGRGIEYDPNYIHERDVKRLGNAITSRLHISRSRKFFMKSFDHLKYMRTGLINDNLAKVFTYEGSYPQRSVPKAPAERCDYEARVLRAVNKIATGLAPEFVGTIDENDRLLMESVESPTLTEKLVEAYNEIERARKDIKAGKKGGSQLKKKEKGVNGLINRGLRTIALAHTTFNSHPDEFSFAEVNDVTEEVPLLENYILRVVTAIKSPEVPNTGEAKKWLLKRKVSSEDFANKIIRYLEDARREHDFVLIHGDCAPHHITYDRHLLDFGNFRKGDEQNDLVRFLKSPLVGVLGIDVTRKILHYLAFRKFYDEVISEEDLQNAHTTQDLVNMLEEYDMDKQSIVEFIRAFYDITFKEHIHIAAATVKYNEGVIKHITGNHPTFPTAKSLIEWYMEDAQRILATLLSPTGRRILVTDKDQQRLLIEINELGIESGMFPSKSLEQLINGREERVYLGD